MNGFFTLDLKDLCRKVFVGGECTSFTSPESWFVEMVQCLCCTNKEELRDFSRICSLPATAHYFKYGLGVGILPKICLLSVGVPISSKVQSKHENTKEMGWVYIIAQSRCLVSP